MTLNLPIGPFFTSPLEQESSGVDFLGLRQVNLDMMDICLPGINNYTRYVRVFSLISWIYWKFYKIANELNILEPTEKQLELFKEKTEVLFNWGHKGLDLAGIPGITSEPPTNQGEVDLSFTAWERSASNTSLMAAPTYGPASKSSGGLGFIELVKNNFYKAKGNGVRLAEALDEQLEKLEGYTELISFSKFTGTEDIAKNLLNGWDVRKPSFKEQKAFWKSFYDPDSIGQKNKISQRSQTVSWILEVLQKAKMPIPINSVRRSMTYRHVENQGFVPIDGHKENAWLGWFVLQIRQAQRLGFEALLAWIEERVMANGEKSIEETIIFAMKNLQSHQEIFPNCDRVGDFLKIMEQHFRCLDDYVQSVAESTEFCLFSSIDSLLSGLKDNSDIIIPTTLKILFISSYLSRLISDSASGLRQLNFGGRDRISLKFWQDIVQKWSERSIEEFLLYIFENFILSQHFGVAASRFDGKRQRLRITIEEEGLSSMVSKRLEPFIGDDRLEMALLLLADAGIIAKTSDGSFYSI